jgi:hypothetical protein
VLTNAGVSVPGTIVNELRLASLDAFASATVTTIVYVSVVVRSGAVVVIVIVVAPEAAMSHVDGDAFPGEHAPPVDAYATVALTSFVVAVTAALVVPNGTSAVYSIVVLTNAGVNTPGSIASSASIASSDGAA